MFQSTSEMNDRAVYLHKMLPWDPIVNQIVSDYENDLRGPDEFRKILVRDAARNRSEQLVINSITYSGPDHPGRYLIMMTPDRFHNKIVATFISEEDNVKSTKSMSWVEQDRDLWDFMMGDYDYGDHFSHIQPQIHNTGDVSAAVCVYMTDHMRKTRMLTLAGQEAAASARFRMSSGRLTNVAECEPERDTYDMCAPESTIYSNADTLRFTLSEILGADIGRIVFVYAGVQKVSGENIVYQRPDFGFDQVVTRFANVKVGPDAYISLAIRGWMMTGIELFAGKKWIHFPFHPDNLTTRRVSGPNVWSYIMGVKNKKINAFIKQMNEETNESEITLSPPEINKQLRQSLETLLNPILNDYAHSMDNFNRIWTN